MLDRDRDGFLQQGELMGLARLMGFNFSEDEWRAEYQELCRRSAWSFHGGGMWPWALGALGALLVNHFGSGVKHVDFTMMFGGFKL